MTPTDMASDTARQAVALEQPVRSRSFPRFLARRLTFRRVSSLNRRRQPGEQNSCGLPPERRGSNARKQDGRVHSLRPTVATLLCRDERSLRGQSPRTSRLPAP